MSPGGHLVTTAAACAATAYATGSAPLTAAVAAGGFLIDVDHAVDYVVFDGQRDLRPGAFLRHYVEGRVRYAVLVLHSYELFAVLGAIAWWTQAPLPYSRTWREPSCIWASTSSSTDASRRIRSRRSTRSPIDWRIVSTRAPSLESRSRVLRTDSGGRSSRARRA